ncbi:J domain-containing protein [Sphingomonas sp.]|uniref:J domain-containing protein n=1 Tax=Sphingomonas sp. TaxID=28214 RepID=UPI0025E8CBFA|nr:J domain-containing protein [Sphingomonas sp.]
MPTENPPRHTRFHGRVENAAALCAEPGCREPGEFRSPLEPGNFDGPGAWRWLCLDHVREFNARYNFFNGMSPDEIEEQQRPFAGWERETRAFSTVGADRPPSWAEFADPLEAISARFKRTMPQERTDGQHLSSEDRRALKELGLNVNADRKALRMAYSERVRRYHPDRNGGDRSHEVALQRTIAAYSLLKGSTVFS